MTPDDLKQKLKEIQENTSPEERVKQLKVLRDMLKETNEDLENLYNEIKEEVDKEKSET